MILGESTKLRPLTRKDLELVRLWRNHDEIRCHMYSTGLISSEEHLAWFDRLSAEPGRHLMIFEVANVPHGFINIGPADASGCAAWGFYVAPGSTRGTGKILGASTLRYAFDELGLKKVRGEVLASNQASINFHRSLGFEQEDRPAGGRFDNARSQDVICFGLSAESFRK